MVAKGLTALMAMIFFFLLGRGMSLPIIPSFYQASGLSVTDIGINLGAFGVAFLVSEAGWGFASGILRRRLTIFVLIAVSASTSLFFTRPEPLAVLLPLQVVSAVCVGGLGLFPRLTISRLVDPGSRGGSFGYLGLVFALGPMAGSILGAAVSSVVGLWETFEVVALVSTVAIVPLYLVPFREWKGEKQVSSEGTTSSQAAIPAGRPLGRLELSVLGAVALTTSSCTSFFVLLFPNVLTQDPSFSAPVFGVAAVIAIFSLSSGVFQPVMASLGSGRPRAWIVAGLVVSGLTFLLLAGFHDLQSVYAISLLAGAAASIVTPLALVILSSGVSAGQIGRTLGLYGAAEDFGIITGASFGTFIWVLWGTGAMFYVMGAQCVVVGLVYALASKVQPRK